MGEIIDIVDEVDAFDKLRNRLLLAALLANDRFPRAEPGVVLRSRGEVLLDDGPAPFVLVSILSRFEYIFHERRGEGKTKKDVQRPLYSDYADVQRP